MSDIINIQQALTDSLQSEEDVQVFNPVQQVQNSLMHFYTHRLNKLQTDIEFEQQLKSAILARLPEADFDELISILNTVQSNTNYGVEKILLPFLPKDGDRVPLLDGGKEKKKEKSSEEDMFDGSNKDLLQAINELNKAVNVITETKACSDTDAIKKALE